MHEGPHAARHYQFVARGIAEALVMVGAGSSYRDAALVARERAKRLRAGPDGEPRFSRHGSLVMDWVEVFAPVVFEPHRPRAWPASGSLLLDDLPFRVRDPQTGRSRIAFRIFAAMGYERGRAKLWQLEAFTTKSQADWEAFLGRLPGAPPRVVCDSDHGLTNAVGARFPGAELYLCEWHLRHALERLMGKLRTEQPEHREAIDELLGDTEAAFTGPSFWAPFTERCHAAGIPRVSEWLNTTGQIVADQFKRRGPRANRPADTPLSTSPLDGFINPIRAAIGPRAYGLKNRQRTNRMLMLMQLHANRQDDINAYLRRIRACLEANHGRPSIARRAIIDAGGDASLR
ncbi:MAG: transposase [Actinobacteria bacterium]|nr:transposase [Actinomycetota bacterium]